MSKRTMEEANNEISEPENTISDNQLTNKIITFIAHITFKMC